MCTGIYEVHILSNASFTLNQALSALRRRRFSAARSLLASFAATCLSNVYGQNSTATGYITLPPVASTTCCTSLVGASWPSAKGSGSLTLHPVHQKAASGASKHSSSSGGQVSASLSSCCSSELMGGCTTSLRAASRCAPRNPEVKYVDHNDVY